MGRRTSHVFRAAILVGAIAPVEASGDAAPRFFDPGVRLSAPQLAANQQFRFVTTADFPPFNMIGPTGNPAGFNIDLAREMCRELAVADRCSVQILPISEALDAVRSGQADALIAGLAISPETRGEFAFSLPYMHMPARFVTNSSTTPADGQWREKRVGVVAGSAHERMLRDFFQSARVVTYGRREWVLEDLRAKKIDAAFGDGMTMSLWLNTEEGRQCCAFAGGAYLAPEYLGFGLSIAVPAGKATLATAFDFALRELERKGVTGELYLRYFPIGFF
ncbi:MAG: transporter substrate-binding domain-containing protein [Phyllobacteriaceae bacterium]|nr:transporter substrate-binding domain-containing protein [Phyllobacteriaceae bacterium]